MIQCIYCGSRKHAWADCPKSPAKTGGSTRKKKKKKTPPSYEERMAKLAKRGARDDFASGTDALSLGESPALRVGQEAIETDAERGVFWQRQRPRPPQSESVPEDPRGIGVIRRDRAPPERSREIEDDPSRATVSGALRKWLRERELAGADRVRAQAALGVAAHLDRADVPAYATAKLSCELRSLLAEIEGRPALDDGHRDVRRLLEDVFRS